MEKIDLVIIGCGGSGREILWQILSSKEKNKYNILGFIDDKKSENAINGFNVIGNIDYLLQYERRIAALICVGCAKTRKLIYDKLSTNKNIEFPTFIADTVKYSDTVSFGKGCVICEANILTVNIKIGDFVQLNLSSTIGHDVIIQDFVTVYPGVNISGNVNIGEATEIGTGTRIIQGKNVGKGAIIGAGSVIIRDIPDNCTAVGVPAKVIKEN